MTKDGRASLRLACGLALLAGATRSSPAQADAPPKVPARRAVSFGTPFRPRAIADPAIRSAGALQELPPVQATPIPLPSADGPRDGDGPKDKVSAAPPAAAARFEGRAAPGVQVVLNGDGSTGVGLRYLWVQTGGPQVPLADAEKPSVRVTIPRDAASLEFLLIVSNEAGVDKVRLAIPIEERSSAEAVPELKADAGDDQVGIVGRQLTLNGGRSTPRGKVGYRWIQTGGPTVTLKIEDGHVFSFVPDRQGTYRFALVVASGGVISEPDEVEVVTMGSSPSARVSGPRREDPSPPVVAPRPSYQVRVPAAKSRPEDPGLLDQFVAASLAGLDGGAASGEELATAFEGVAERMSLYRSYSEAFSELSRRLDPLVPSEPARRAAWIEKLFAPVTSRLVDELRREGLDLSNPAGRDAAMTDAQRQRMIDVFRAIGEGARAAATGSGRAGND